MKDVLISTQPKWVAKICNEIGKRADGTPVYEKEIEVRKTRPKQEVPFRCFIYATKSGDRITIKGDKVFEISKELTGKVIGEFICNEVKYIHPAYGYLDARCEGGSGYILDKCCLTSKQLIEYGKGKDLYAWHISNLVIYDKPKELSEFLIDCKNCNKKFVGDTNCWQGCVNGYRRLTRPPQSWCYVEEV